MVLLGDKPQDTDLVYGEINKKLKEDINATVEVEFVGWGDVFTKIPLMLSSGDDFDLIATANWNNYFPNSRSGAYREITREDLEKYAPQTLANTAQEVFDSAMVDGKLYALPMNYREITIHGFLVRGDLMKKYQIPDIKTLEDFETYLAAVKQNEPEMIPWDTNNNALFVQEHLTRPFGLYNPDGTLFTLPIDEAKPKYEYMYDSPNAAALFHRLRDWNEKGYWQKNALASKVPAAESMKSGKSAATFENLPTANTLFQVMNVEHPEWDVRFYPVNADKPYLANPFINNGIAIGKNSKNPERALMMLDLFRNDVDYAHLTYYGIKGKHYEISEDNQLISLPGATGFPPNGAYPYGWIDDRFFLTPDNGLSNYAEVLKRAQDQVKQTNLRSFTPDLNDVKNNNAALSEINTQYVLPLYHGVVKGTVEEELQSIKGRMEKAGLNEVRELAQKQLDQFEVVLK
ncbi:extracellular solute-binding protein [Paenibacillus sp.]|uniref:extracellular solute-binding protein n=1 Tax=Paenibacillus sp. TaxID=58172 RepID=UPI002D43796D|nr:extracellular solute-binding protein [Paenibacillus sp.]HZG57806.1 extracellular solute-binding protein [Paenibacillus sp.]